MQQLPVDTYIKLIKALSTNAMSDDDPNNALIDKFQTPYENFTYSENHPIKFKGRVKTIYGGKDYPDVGWAWSQGGYYSNNMGVLMCVLML